MKYKLGECIEEIVDKTTENNQYEVLSVTKDGIYSQEEFFKKQIASEDNTGYKIIRKNNLVFSTMNLWMGSLDVLSNYEIGIVSPAYKIFKFDESKMIPSFGKYFMKSHFMLEQYKNCSEQGASIVRRNLDLKQLLDTEIIIPTVEEQCKIVKVLENIDEIINKYTNLIKNKEQFIKSQFVEMFGKLKSNDKNWKKYEKLGNLCLMNPQKSEINDEDNMEVSFIPMQSVSEKGEIDSNQVRLLKDVKSGFTYFKENDVLFAKITPCMENGKGAVAKKLKNGIGFGSTEFYVIRPKAEINSVWLYTLMSLKAFRNEAELYMTGSAGQKRVPISFISDYKIGIPPIELQNYFSKIVQLIDKQKFHSVLKDIIKVKESEVYA